MWQSYSLDAKSEFMDGLENVQPRRSLAPSLYEFYGNSLRLAYAARGAIKKEGNARRQIKADPLGRAEGRF